MKLKKFLLTQTIGDKQMMVAVGEEAKTFRKIIKSNETAAFLVDQLKNETTEEQLVSALREEYKVSENMAKRDVHTVIAKLTSLGVIE